MPATLLMCLSEIVHVRTSPESGWNETNGEDGQPFALTSKRQTSTRLAISLLYSFGRHIVPPTFNLEQSNPSFAFISSANDK